MLRFDPPLEARYLSLGLITDRQSYISDITRFEGSHGKSIICVENVGGLCSIYNVLVACTVVASGIDGSSE